MLCEKCNVELIARERTTQVSGAGLAGALVAVIGLLVLFANTLVGLGIIILGVLIGALMRGKQLVLVCPKCRATTKVA